jgi:hypothetical protein
MNPEIAQIKKISSNPRRVPVRRTRGAPRKANIDLGLAVLCAGVKPTYPMMLDEIAEVCGCSDEAIRRIEKRAMRKLVEHAENSPELRELFNQLVELEVAV